MATAGKLNRSLRAHIERQNMFFVATAAQGGRVNLSPKGMDTLRIIDDTRIIWLNLSGSGNETAAHLLDTPRMTLMFCAFEGDPLILRTYGSAKTLHPRDAEWEPLAARFPRIAGSRQIFDMTIDLVQTSCGTGVPVMAFERSRGETELAPYYDEMGPDGLERFWRKKNAVSLDGNTTGLFPEEP